MSFFYAHISEITYLRNLNYIIELKINGNADDAMSQIKERRYELPFNQDARKLFTIGIGFAQSTHTIDSYEIR